MLINLCTKNGRIYRTVPGALASFDYSAVRQHNRQIDNPILHCSPSNSVGARTSGADHPAAHSTGAWIHREEQSMFLYLSIQIFPLHTRLDDNIQILRMKLYNLIHMFAEGNADTALRSSEVTFQWCSARKRNNRHTTQKKRIESNGFFAICISSYLKRLAIFTISTTSCVFLG